MYSSVFVSLQMNHSTYYLFKKSYKIPSAFSFQCDAQVYDEQMKLRGLTARGPYGCVVGCMVGLQIDHH